MAVASSQLAAGKRKLLFVGAFPPATSRIVGGNVSDCKALLASSFSARFDLILLDSTQASLPAPPLPIRICLAGVRIARFFLLFENRRPDGMLIFAASGVSFLEKVLFAAYGRVRGAPALFSIRSGHFVDLCRRSRAFRGITRVLLKIPARLLCQGEHWRRFFTMQMGVPSNRCVVLENWVASDQLLALGERRNRTAAARAPSPTRILFLGWIERFKGIFELIEAAEMLRSDAQTRPFVISIAGEGSETTAVKTMINAKGLSEHVCLEGVLYGDSKLGALERADIFVLPSHTEGLPNAMIEAMAAGLPVLVTPVGSVPDVVIGDANGLLVPPRNSAALASALRRLINSRETRLALGEAAFQTAKARFGTERAAALLSSLVDEIVGSRRLA